MSNIGKKVWVFHAGHVTTGKIIEEFPETQGYYIKSDVPKEGGLQVFATDCETNKDIAIYRCGLEKEWWGSIAERIEKGQL